MVASKQSTMTERRALLTDREREVLQGTADDVQDLGQYQSKVRSRIRSRLDRLEADLSLLDTHEPELAGEIRTSVCGDTHDRLSTLEEEMDQLRDRVDDDAG